MASIQVPKATVGLTTTPTVHYARTTPDQFGASAAGQLSNVANQLAQREIQKMNLANVQKATSALYDFNNNALYGQDGLYTKKGSDAIGAADEVGKNFDLEVQKQNAILTNDSQRRMFQTRVDSMRQSLTRQSMAYQVRESQSFQQQQSSAIVANAGKAAALNYKDPEEVQKQLKIQSQTILLNGDLNGLPPEEVQQQIQAARTQTQTSIVKQMTANRDYDGAIDYIEQNKNDFAGVGPVLARQIIQSKEQDARATLAEEARAERAASKRQKILYSNTAKAGDELLATGKLTFDWINSNKDNLSEDDYRYFTRQSSGIGTTKRSNIDAYIDLDKQARTGVDISDDARNYLRSGLITQSDYDKLMNRSEQHDQLPTPYKQGEQYLSRVFQVNPLNPAVGAAERRANALNEYDDWYRKNSDASVSEAMEQASKLYNRYALADLNEKQRTVLYGAAPLYLQGGRQAPDLKATWNATKQAYTNGDISKQEYIREAELIKQWNQIQKETTPTTKIKGDQ